MIDSSVTTHLRKYFELACSRFEDGDYALATFFAITLIEECAKILILRDADLQSKDERQRAVDHSEKHWTALVNLLSSSEEFDTLPKRLPNEVEELIEACQTSLNNFRCADCNSFVWSADRTRQERLQCSCGQLQWRYG